MTDLTPILNELLKSQNARPTADPLLTLQNIDQFLKEAYRIVSNFFGLSVPYLTSLEFTHHIPSLLPQRYTPVVPLNSSPASTNTDFVQRVQSKISQ
jgi:syntaxin 18